MTGYILIIPGLQQGDTLKTTLSQPFIINKLSINVKPALSRSGKIVFEANPAQNSTLFSMTTEKLLLVSGKSQFDEKTYVIQRRVASSDRNVSEGRKPSSVLKVKLEMCSIFQILTKQGK